MDFAADLRLMLSDFGVIAQGGTCTVGGVSTEGIFDAAYSDVLDMSGSRPALVCVSADVSTAKQGTAVVVNSVSYTVGSKQDSPEDLGPGMTRLLLQKV
jgi:hypothetical protein